MTRRWMLENLELLKAYQDCVHGKEQDPLPVMSDLVNTTGRTEVAVFVDAHYADMAQVRDSLVRGKKAGVRHVIPAGSPLLSTKERTGMADALSLDYIVANLPPGKGSWRKQWRDWCLVHRCDHTVVFRDKGSQSKKEFVDVLSEYPTMGDRLHIFELGKAKPKVAKRGRSKAE